MVHQKVSKYMHVAQTSWCYLMINIKSRWRHPKQKVLCFVLYFCNMDFYLEWKHINIKNTKTKEKAKYRKTMKLQTLDKKDGH